MPKDMQRQVRSGLQMRLQALASAHKTTAAHVEITIQGLTPLPIRVDSENYQGCPPMAMLMAVPARLVSTSITKNIATPFLRPEQKRSSMQKQALMAMLMAVAA